jgi:uncharacterized damage-inducible protein DinB
MTIGDVRGLFAYGSWANARFFAAAEALADEELRAAAASSFASVRATLGHIVGAEWIWLRRWRGESLATPPIWVANASLTELKVQLVALEADRETYLGSLTDAALDRPLVYRSLSGEAHSDALGGTLQHVVNHSTYHRGQAASQLRQLGRIPPNTDLIAYLRQKK